MNKLLGIKLRLNQSLRLIFVLTLSVIMVGGSLVYVKDVQAESAQEEINRLTRENADNQSALSRLSAEASSYEDAISKMQAEISDLEAKLRINLAEQDRLNGEIKVAEEELARQKDLLGRNIRAMYVEGSISTIEMLASSNNLSEFVDKQQYRDSVKNKITDTLTKINDLKHQLRAQKEQVDKLVTEQNQQRETLAKSRNEQGQLLAMNQGQQKDFNNKIRANSSRLQQLIASQRNANFTDGGYYFIRFSGTVGNFNPDGYEYRNSGFGMSPGGCVDNDGPDRWNYCTRQCVSFAAWAVRASGRSTDQELFGWGDAKKWVAAAYARGIPVYRTPQPGDVAISTSGNWGHAMYVVGVSGNKFYTWEYNTNLDGRLYRFEGSRYRTF